MDSAYPNTIMDAFISLAFDIPPLAYPGVNPITGGAILMGSQTWPMVKVDTTRHLVIGLTASDWMMIDGMGDAPSAQTTSQRQTSKRPSLRRSEVRTSASLSISMEPTRSVNSSPLI